MPTIRSGPAYSGTPDHRTYLTETRILLRNRKSRTVDMSTRSRDYNIYGQLGSYTMPHHGRNRSGDLCFQELQTFKARGNVIFILKNRSQPHIWADRRLTQL